MNKFDYQTTQVIIKPTSACNFRCTFCSARNLNIPIHNTVPKCLREYLCDKKPTDIVITGGEPLINPISYFKDLLRIMDDLEVDYTIGLTSNLMLWYENPEKWDWLFNNPKIGIDTSFQYGDERKDNEIYTEERFIDLYNKFYERYNKKLMFISVINNDNEKYAIKTCELAKKLGTTCKLNCQLPVGGATEYYPRYKLLQIYLNLIKLGLDKYEMNLVRKKDHHCSFTTSYQFCAHSQVVYVDSNEKLVVGNCEEVMSSEGRFSISKGSLFSECYACPMFSICNACSMNRQSTLEKGFKEEHCKWMKEHYMELKENDLI